MFEAVLDFLIRNQALFFRLLGGLISIGGLILFYLLHADTPLTRRFRLALGFPALPIVSVSVVPLLALGIGYAVSEARVSPVEWLSLPAPLCAQSSNKTLLVFIHGWKGDETTWRNFPSLACGDTSLKETDVLVVHYPTFLVRRSLNIITLADWIKNQLAPVKKSGSYQQIRIIAHSMGGLVAREFTLLKSTDTGTERSIDLIIEVATPHLGVPVAQVSEFLENAIGIPSTYAARDLEPDSSYLKGLHARWNNLRPRPKTVCYTSPQDMWVSVESATYQCDEQINYPGGSHTELVKPEAPNDLRYVLPMQEVFKQQSG